MIKKISAFLVVFALLLVFVLPVFAETVTVYSTQSLTNTTVAHETGKRVSGKIEDLSPITDKNLSTGGLPNVQIDQAKSWIERKGYQVVDVLQTFVQPFAIVVFIGCAMMSLLGAFGSSGLVVKGVIGMVIAVIMYAVVLAAPELLDFAIAWLHS